MAVQVAKPLLVGSRVIPGRSPMADSFVVTLAQLNAGKQLVFGQSAVRWRVLDVKASVIGTFTTLTDVRLSTDEATPVDIITIPAASLVGGVSLSSSLTPAIVKPTGGATIDAESRTAIGSIVDAGGFVLGAGFNAKLGAGAGIQARKTGSAGAGGTSIEFLITYRMETGLYAVSPD